MIADIFSNRKHNPIATELFIRVRKLSFFVFITESYFAVPENVKLNSTHYFITKTPKKGDLNHSSDIDYKDFMNLYESFLLVLLLHQIILYVSKGIF